MGFLGSETLNRTKVQGWIEKYDLSTFIETGLQKGNFRKVTLGRVGIDPVFRVVAKLNEQIELVSFDLP